MILDILFFIIFVFLVIVISPIILVKRLFFYIAGLLRGPLTAKELKSSVIPFGAYVTVKDKGMIWDIDLEGKKFFVFKSQEGVELLLDKGLFPTTISGSFEVKGWWEFPPLLNTYLFANTQPERIR